MTDSTTKKPAELESLRADIDRSDEAIVGALRTRLGAVRRIAEVKRLQGLPVYDAVREGPFSTSCARWRVPTSRASPCPSTAL